MFDLKSLPSWDELPSVPGCERLRGCAWGLWGEGDELGTVNMLTPEVVAAAARSEIRTGISMRIDGPLNFPSKPAFGRKALQHTILPMISKAARDDEVSFNTQVGAQWDGLRHYGVTDLDLFYGGVTNDEIPLGSRQVKENTKDPLDYRLSIHHWAEHGITGRGVLLDVARFAKECGIEGFGPYNGFALTAEQLSTVAMKEGVEFQQGDILVMRTGAYGDYMARTADERAPLMRVKTTTFSGVEQSDDVRRFLWNNHFSAIVSDAMSFEVLPTKEGRKMMHQDFLGLWGLPIGELFDLEGLSKHCEKESRYTFFFNSIPLNVIGGVGTPPCAQAIF